METKNQTTMNTLREALEKIMRSTEICKEDLVITDIRAIASEALAKEGNQNLFYCSNENGGFKCKQQCERCSMLDRPAKEDTGKAYKGQETGTVDDFVYCFLAMESFDNKQPAFMQVHDKLKKYRAIKAAQSVPPYKEEVDKEEK